MLKFSVVGYKFLLSLTLLLKMLKFSVVKVKFFAILQWNV